MDHWLWVMGYGPKAMGMTIGKSFGRICSQGVRVSECWHRGMNRGWRPGGTGQGDTIHRGDGPSGKGLEMWPGTHGSGVWADGSGQTRGYGQEGVGQGVWLRRWKK